MDKDDGDDDDDDDGYQMNQRLEDEMGRDAMSVSIFVTAPSISSSPKLMTKSRYGFINKQKKHQAGRFFSWGSS